MALEWEVKGRTYAKTKCNRFQILLSRGSILRVFAATDDPLNPLKQIGELRDRGAAKQLCEDYLSKQGDKK